MTFRDLAENESNPKNIRNIYEIIADKEKLTDSGVSDGFSPHSFDEINEIKTFLYEEVKENLATDGLGFQSLEEVKKDLTYKIKDGFYNSFTGIGTINDPTTYNASYVPTSISPWEATGFYSSGSLCKIIIDKKSKVLLMNGFEFEGDITPDEAKELKEYALRIGFDKILKAGFRDALIYGGSIVFPQFKNDTPLSYGMGLKDLMESGILDKNCIDYFIEVDRWNSVVIPDYIITHKDYLMPKEIYIPLGGLRIKTQRASLLKPYPQPYWSAIKQLGWSVSDFVGYINQILAYEIMIQTLPMMFQQMSLLFQIFPIDSTIAMNGAEAVNDFIKKNEEKMREWSMVNPKAINSFGDIKVVERNFTGMHDMVQIMRQDIASRSSIAESVLFHTQPTGFSDNKDDLVLKQSETIRMLGAEFSSQLLPSIKALQVSCFGKEFYDKKININFNTPIVQSDTEKADTGLKFSQFISGLTASGMPLDVSIKQAQQFFPSYKIDDEDLERLEVVTPAGDLEKSPSLFDLLNGPEEPEMQENEKINKKPATKEPDNAKSAKE